MKLLAALWVVTIACGVYSSCARGQQPSPAIRGMQGCVALGMWVSSITDMRDIGSNRAKHLALIRERNAGETQTMVDLLLDEAKRVYAHPERTHRELGGDAFERCMLGVQRRQG